MIIGKPVKIYNEIYIEVPPKKVFDCVTQPDLWHEWHPASTSAELPRKPLQVNDAFREVITVAYPFVKIRRHTEYLVAKCEPYKLWEVHGKSSLFNLSIRYVLVPQDSGTLFQRTLTYRVKGLLAWFEWILVRPKIRSQSRIALNNLKQKLES